MRGVRPRQPRDGVPKRFETSAPPINRSLRPLRQRGPVLAACCSPDASIASRIASPPRLKSSISTRNVPSTRDASGAPAAKSSRVRAIKRLHQPHVALIKSPRANVLFVQSMRAQRLQRNIDPALLQIARNVLPEIRQLQGRAGVIRKPLPLRIAVIAKIKHQPPTGFAE